MSLQELLELEVHRKYKYRGYKVYVHKSKVPGEYTFAIYQESGPRCFIGELCNSIEEVETKSQRLIDKRINEEA